MNDGVRPDPRPEAARTALADAMVDLLSEPDQGAVTISELCIRARVSRPTFYRYFHSTDDVLALAIDQRLDTFRDRVPAPDSPAPLPAAIPQDIAGFLTDVWRERTVYGAALSPDSPYVRSKYVVHDWLRDTLGRYASYFELDEEYVRTLIEFIAGGALAVIVEVVGSEDLTRTRIDEMGEELWRIVHGIAQTFLTGR
jgi:AcrR family transcriptional regulator